MVSTLLCEPVMRPLSVKAVPLSCHWLVMREQAGGLDAEHGGAAQHD
jgi:hypothetical protein